MAEDKIYMKEEIRKEFQLERMIVFSDAVFAIVITLMAIEIRVPEISRTTTSDILHHELVKLIPPVVSYAISFFFIGITWYQHLQIFSLLKDYDKGLVIRNLVMLFFIGLFPFSAALMVKLSNGFAIPFVIYFAVIFSSRSALLLLQHYVLFKRPHLRIKTSIDEEILRYRNSRMILILLAIVFLLMVITYNIINDPEIKPYAFFWFLPFPIVRRLLKKKMLAKNILKE